MRGVLMLSRLLINHFKALNMVDIELRPLTVLIGKNDTGKSSFLSAVELLANGLDLTLEHRFRRDASIVTAIKTSLPSRSRQRPIAGKASTCDLERDTQRSYEFSVHRAIDDNAKGLVAERLFRRHAEVEYLRSFTSTSSFSEGGDRCAARCSTIPSLVPGAPRARDRAG